MSEELKKQYSQLSSKDLTATFVNACYLNDLDSFLCIIDDKELFKKVDKNYHSMGFELACSKGHLEIVKKFKTEKNTVSVVYFLGCKKACINNQLKVVDFFLQDGIVDLELDQLLDQAFKSGHAEIAKRILTCDLFKKTPQILGTNHPEYKSIFLCGKLFHLNDVFLKACKDGHLSIVKLLLLDKDIPKNADINYSDYEGLIAAYDSHNEDIVKFLLTSHELKEHADVHAQNDALFIHACRAGDLHFMEYLLTSPDLKEHSNINAQDGKAITYALRLDRDDIAKFLLTDDRLKEHIDLSKNIDNLYCAHYERIDEDYDYDNEYEYKVLNYIVCYYKFIPKDKQTETMLNQILASSPELKQKYQSIKVATQLEQEFNESGNNKEKDTNKRLKI